MTTLDQEPSPAHSLSARLMRGHVAIWRLYVATALRGLYIHEMPGGFFSLYRLSGRQIEPVGSSWLRMADVSRLCGAGNGETLESAAALHGLKWPKNPEKLVDTFYAKLSLHGFSNGHPDVSSSE